MNPVIEAIEALTDREFISSISQLSNPPQPMHIVQASLEDAQGILELQKLAYRSEAAIYDDFNIPPLRQTIEELRSELAAKIVLKAVVDGRIVGSVRAWAKEGTCYIERLIVHPDFQGRGICTSLAREREGPLSRPNSTYTCNTEGVLRL